MCSNFPEAELLAMEVLQDISKATDNESHEALWQVSLVYGNALVTQKKYNEAERALSATLRNIPSNDPALVSIVMNCLFLLGTAQIGIGDRIAGISSLEISESLRPKTVS
ncbi:MAG: hypothetical protein ABJB66_21800, partial [Gemmatimonadaceae bacterium]